MSNLKRTNRMKALTTHRLLDCFRKAVQEEESISENILSSAYDEFSDHLASLAESRLPIPERLRRLRHMETELDAYMNMAGSRADSRTHIYLMKASGLVRTEIELLHFALRYPEYCAVHPATEENNSSVISLHWKSSLVNLMELIASLYYLGVITDGNGNRQSFASLVVAFEGFLHIRIPKPYDLRADLARRKKSLSVLLPKLREAFEKNIINCGIGHG